MEKDHRHLLNIERTGSLFYPLGVETFGLWSSSSLEVLKNIARKTTITSGLTISKASIYLHERLSVCLWKYNSKMILALLTISSVSDKWDSYMYV